MFQRLINNWKSLFHYLINDSWVVTIASHWSTVSRVRWKDDKKFIVRGNLSCLQRDWHLRERLACVTEKTSFTSFCQKTRSSSNFLLFKKFMKNQDINWTFHIKHIIIFIPNIFLNKRSQVLKISESFDYARDSPTLMCVAMHIMCNLLARDSPTRRHVIESPLLLFLSLYRYYRTSRLWKKFWFKNICLFFCKIKKKDWRRSN